MKEGVQASDFCHNFFSFTAQKQCIGNTHDSKLMEEEEEPSVTESGVGSRPSRHGLDSTAARGIVGRPGDAADNDDMHGSGVDMHGFG